MPFCRRVFLLDFQLFFQRSFSEPDGGPCVMLTATHGTICGEGPQSGGPKPVKFHRNRHVPSSFPPVPWICPREPRRRLACQYPHGSPVQSTLPV